MKYPGIKVLPFTPKLKLFNLFTFIGKNGGRV